MIFYTHKQEIYYLLSLLLENCSFDIINYIYSFKENYDKINNLQWYINHGIEMNKIKYKSLSNDKLFTVLFDPYRDNNFSYPIIYGKLFKFKIIFKTLKYDNFYLIQQKNINIYNPVSISNKIKIINDLLKNGIEELKLRLFLYKTSFLKDREGNICFRPIIINDKFKYEYKTIAIIDNIFTDPIERLPSLIN